MTEIVIAITGADENLERVLSGLIEGVLVKNGFNGVSNDIKDSLGNPVKPESMVDGAKVLLIRQPSLNSATFKIISVKTEEGN